MLRLNACDGGTRRFLCMQAPESLDGDPDFATIADVARERLAKVRAGLGADAPAIELWRWEAFSVAD